MPARRAAAPRPRNVRGTDEWIADQQDRLGKIARRHQTELSLDLAFEAPADDQGDGQTALLF